MTARVPAYCRHKATNTAYLTVATGDSRGPKYLGSWGSDRSFDNYREALTGLGFGPEQIDAALVAARAKFARPNPSRQTAFTVRQLYAEFIRWAPTYYRLPSGEPTSEVRSFRCALKDVLARLGSTATDNVRPADLYRIRQSWIDRRWCRKTINDHLGRVIRVFRWGLDEDRGFVSEQTVAVLRLIRPLRPFRSAAKESRVVVGADPVAVESTAAAVDPVVGAMLRLQLYTGMRPGEVRSLRRPMVRTEDGRAVIDFQFEHKTGYRQKRRVVPLGPRAAELLAPWLARCESDGQFVFRPALLRRPKTKLSKFEGWSYARMVRSGCKKAGVVTFSPNQIRHLVAEEVRRSHGLDAAQALLGHSQRATTERYYAPVTNSLAADVADRRG